MIITACRDCEVRYVGCHAKCQRYLDQKKLRDEYKKADWERRKSAQSYSYDQNVKLIKRIRKNKRK